MDFPVKCTNYKVIQISESAFLVLEDAQSPIHFPDEVPDFLDVFSVLETVLIVRWDDFAEDVLVVFLNLGGELLGLVVHVFELSIDGLLEPYELEPIGLALSETVAYFFVAVDVSIGEDRLEFLLEVGLLLLVFGLLDQDVPQLVLLHLVLGSPFDAGLQQP